MASLGPSVPAPPPYTKGNETFLMSSTRALGKRHLGTRQEDELLEQ